MLLSLNTSSLVPGTRRSAASPLSVLPSSLSSQTRTEFNSWNPMYFATSLATSVSISVPLDTMSAGYSESAYRLLSAARVPSPLVEVCE